MFFRWHYFFKFKSIQLKNKLSVTSSDPRFSFSFFLFHSSLFFNRLLVLSHPTFVFLNLIIHLVLESLVSNLNLLLFLKSLRNFFLKVNFLK